MNRLVCLLLVLGIACWLPAGVLAQDDTSTTTLPANETSAAPASDAAASGKTKDGAAASTASEGAAGEGVATESEPGMVEWVETEGIETLLVTLLVLTPFAAFALGRIFIIKVFRAKDLSGHFGLICFSIVAPAVVILSNYKDGEIQLNWGVDLQGGVILVYEVEDKEKQDSSVMQAMVQTLGNRLNKSGLKEIVVRPYGDRQVEIIIPEADDIEISRIKKQITTAGVLEFHIVASERDHADVVAQARLNAQAEGPQRRERLVREGGVDDGLVIGKWVRLMDPSEWGTGDIVRDERTGTILDASGLNQLLPDYERRLEQARQRQTEQGGGSLRVPLGAEILMAVADEDDQVLGEHLDVVRPDTDEQMRPCISFGMNQLGADRMGLLTANNLPTNDFYRRLGIVMDRDLTSAPRIMSTIRDQGRITGSFEKEDVDLIVGVLQSGRLQTTLQENPISEDKIGATLGEDTISRGKTAIGMSLALVLVFILAYYRFAGVVACLALLLNLLLILALMILLKAAVTLPGLAGLVLTVGMSVDANVLIFERIREELKKGAALRLAIRNGFARATTTIVDANVTTLITAIILYAIGTDQVRGFAVTLILGIMMSMYTAIFCSRVVFNLWERKRYLTKLSMGQILGATQIDFIGKRSLAAAFSVLVIVVGLGAVADRGSLIFDIDFTGGTSVTMLLDKTTDSDADYDDQLTVRDIVEGILDKVSVDEGKVTYSLSKVELEDEPDRVAWKLDTTIPSEAVRVQQGAKTLLKKLYEDAPAGSEGQVVAGVDFLKEQLQQATGFGGGENGQSAFAHYQVTVEESTFEEVPQVSSEGAPQAPVAEPATAGEQEPVNPEPAEPAAADDTAAPAPSNDDGARREQPQQRIASLRRQGFVVAQEETPPAAAADETAPTVDASTTDPAAPATDAEPPVTGSVSAAANLDTVGILEFKTENGINGVTLKQELSNAAAAVDIPLGVDDDELLNEGNIRVAKAAAGSRDVDPDWFADDSSPQERWRVTLVGLPKDQALTVVRQLEKSFAEEPIWPASSTIGGRVAGDMQATAVAALIASLMGIVGYLWIRFQRVIYGLAAVVALLHDVLVTLGAIALSAYVADYLGWLMIEEFKISLPMVAAFLTIVGYSLNDTIVVFDRIREVRGKSPSITDVMVNTSINQTLGRTLLTSLTTLFVVVTLYALGGAGIHGFAFALVVGVMVGTYSSIFVASPALLWMARRAVARGDTV